MKIFIFLILLVGVLFSQKVTKYEIIETSDFRITDNDPNKKLTETENVLKVEGNRATWSESSDLLTSAIVYIGPGYYYLPDLYVRTDNYRLLFQTYPHINYKMQISYNNGQSWTTIRNGANYDSGWIELPWTDLGEHTLKIRYVNGNSWVYATFKVFTIPDINRRFYDSDGNSILLWSSGSNSLDKPTVMIEGFDPSNSNYSEIYYYLSQDLINETKFNGNDFAIVNFADGGDDMMLNAGVIDNALRYISNIQSGDSEIILAGLSMGGVIGRYCLSKAEQLNNPLNVSHFLSIDSPQKYAVFDENLLEYIEENDSERESPLNSMAAKQLLISNPYDDDSGNYYSYHNVFYRELNQLNGDGYPNLCKNIGVSFANIQQNPNTGIWLKINYDIWIWPDRDSEEYYLYDDIRVPGSYLPESTTKQCGTFNFAIGIYQGDWDFERLKDPTFIPYVSALDLYSGNSKFDVTINPTSTHFHDDLPEEIIDEILDELGIVKPALAVSISGPTSLGYNISSTFTANPSGGSSTYTNYRWWWRNDGGILPESISEGIKGDLRYAPPGGYWFELTYYEGQQSLSIGKPDDFSLKCEVTDSDNNTATDIHSVNVGGFLAKAQSEMSEISLVAVPENVELTGNYPNPFNPSTTIKFGLPEDSHVKISIYSITGQEIISLTEGSYSRGYHQIKWYGKNQAGNSVSNGIYIYELRAGDHRLIKKMVFTK